MTRNTSTKAKEQIIKKQLIKNKKETTKSIAIK